MSRQTHVAIEEQIELLRRLRMLRAEAFEIEQRLKALDVEIVRAAMSMSA